ncbi:hypothetical protein X975_03154, partial [Stegodyphus mimosarum]
MEQETLQDDSPSKIWKKHIRRDKRLRGESYIGFRGVEHAARPMLASPCYNKSNHQCSALISEAERQNIYNSFRALPTINDQRYFIVQHVKKTQKKKATSGDSSRRENTNIYSFAVNGESMKVCREFFMATLNVTDAFIRTSLSKISSSGILQPDLRGHHPPHNKFSPETEANIREFILSFPITESYYSHKISDKKYSSGNLSVAKMYKMFIEHCNEKQLRKVSFESFRKIFREYNAGFCHSKED